MMRAMVATLLLAVCLAVSAAAAFAGTVDPGSSVYHGPFFDQHMDNQDNTR